MLIRFARGKKQPFVFCQHCSSVTSFQGLVALQPDAAWQLILVYIHRQGILLRGAEIQWEVFSCVLYCMNTLVNYRFKYLGKKCAQLYLTISV